MDYTALGNERYAQFAALFWEYWLKVNGEDLSDLIVSETLGVEMPRVEYVLSYYLDQLRCSAELVTSKSGEVVGFVMYRIACDHVLEIRHMYVSPKCSGLGLGKGLVDAIRAQYPIKIVLFQTHKGRPPNRLLEFTEKRRRLVGETEHLFTWLMDWES